MMMMMIVISLATLAMRSAVLISARRAMAHEEQPTLTKSDFAVLCGTREVIFFLPIVIIASATRFACCTGSC
jgi:hypothetical protein